MPYAWHLSTPGAALKAFLLLAMLSLGLPAITAAVTRKNKKKKGKLVMLRHQEIQNTQGNMIG